MRLGYLCHCRRNWGKGDNRKKEYFISIPSPGKLPLNPAFIGQLGVLIPLETVCKCLDAWSAEEREAGIPETPSSEYSVQKNECWGR